MRRPVIAVLAAGVALLVLAGCAYAVLRSAAPASHTCTSNTSDRSGTTDVRDVEQAQRVAMPSRRFWALIATLHGSNSDAAYGRLTHALAKLPESQILGFDARLTLALYALDDECRADWYALHDPSGVGIVGDDDFLYFRADTVTAGYATWRTAVAEDTLPWGATDAVDGDGENLLYVGTKAAGLDGISDTKWLDRESAAFELSYETGSNPAGWSSSTH